MSLTATDYLILFQALEVVCMVIVAVIAGLLAIKSGKSQTSFSVNLDKTLELHTKIHDRMIEIVELIKQGKHIDPNRQIRVRMCASRLNLFDSKKEIVSKTELLLNGWENDLTLFETGGYNSGELSKKKYDSIKLTEEIRNQVDDLLRPLLQQ